MDTRREPEGIRYWLAPFLLYLVVSGTAAYALETIWITGLRDRFLQAPGADRSYAAQTLWQYLSMMIPAGLGCLCVRRSVLQETSFFQKGKSREGLDAGALAVLMVSAAAMSLSANILYLVLAGKTGGLSSVNTDHRGGVCSFLIEAVVYGVYMPFIEEQIFRGLLFLRLRSVYGVRAAVLLSAALFGAWHGAPAQGVYAFAMGIFFASVYEETRSLSVPFAMHGTCNLVVLVFFRTDAWRRACTIAWAAAFFAVAAAGVLTAARRRADRHM